MQRNSIAVQITEPGGDSPRTSLAYAPLANWLYLGQGFRQKEMELGGEFLVDVATFRTRVWPGSHAAE